MLLVLLISIGIFLNVVECKKARDPPKSKKFDNVGSVIKEHIGPKFETNPFRGQFISIRDSRTLNCTFPDLQLCCWYNEPSPRNDLHWVRVSTTGKINRAQFKKHYGDVDMPKSPFLVTTAAGTSANSEDAARFISCIIPCQCGYGQLRFSHWLDNCEMTICTMEVLAKNQGDIQCSLVTGSGNATILINPPPAPFMIVLSADKFGPGSLAIIDNVIYSARIPPTCGTC